MAEIRSVRLMVGLEVHVELATRTKMFSRAPNPAHHRFDGSPPNSLLDPTVLGLPGALPVMNRAAVEMAMMVGLALGCRIAERTRWDRKSYYYPDLPKNYQISQYQLPLCFDGVVELSTGPDARARVGIVRAHLEEDAGKLLHEGPGGHAIDFSIVDLNRAGTPLLEIVTAPDFSSAQEVVAFAQQLRNICRFLGVSEGVMQKGHMRFEPNINTVLTLDDGRQVRTPIVEIKNLNSFKALRGAIEFEEQDQPARWRADRREMGAGTKVTRGWDEGPAGSPGRTVVQREKEDAHDYRYFPEPDLLPVEVSPAWVEEVRARVPELPAARAARYAAEFALGAKEAAALVDERDVCRFYEQCVEAAAGSGVEPARAGKACANLLLQSGARRANESGVLISELGITPRQVAALVRLREADRVTSTTADELFGKLCDLAEAMRRAVAADRELSGIPARLYEAVARAEGLDPEEVRRRAENPEEADLVARSMIVRDDGALAGWIERAIAENPKVADDVRGGKLAAAGRLVGVVMKLSAGTADAKAVRAKVLGALGQKE
ncbi:MAG TPA: Asp-tRNA(Asn)/Glu-tRNA(Gln) amidotransferase subunit GatB [Phycisphaerales bacterium]|nr:Asp-tRNA(Asn)/Glu-tRNA(Gln) amidotransferase subunit GatB [Phycisphaerales bacterium]